METPEERAEREELEARQIENLKQLHELVFGRVIRGELMVDPPFRESEAREILFGGRRRK